jgi:hypothetical protein
MLIAKTSLESNDFPVNADGKKIKKQDGTPIASSDDPDHLVLMDGTQAVFSLTAT